MSKFVIETDWTRVEIIYTRTDHRLLNLTIEDFDDLCEAIKKFKIRVSTRKYAQSAKGKAAMHEVYMRRKLKGLTQKGE